MKFDSSAFVADHELMAALERHSSPVDCDASRLLFAQGDPPVGLYLLKSGSVVLTMISPEGRQIFHIPVSAGAVLGLPALIGNAPYSLTAVAEPGACVRFVSSEEFAAVMAETPSLSISVLRVLAAEVRTARFAFTES